jgi:hypothetical protein
VLRFCTCSRSGTGSQATAGRRRRSDRNGGKAGRYHQDY